MWQITRRRNIKWQNQKINLGKRSNTGVILSVAEESFWYKEKIMKIRSRNLLTAILALLCAVTLIFGIAFMLPKSEKINADAAVAVNRTSYTPTFIGQHFILSSNASRQFSDFSTTLNPSLSQINCNNNEFTITKELDCYSIASYIQFTADIVVPANTEYKEIGRAHV